MYYNVVSGLSRSMYVGFGNYIWICVMAKHSTALWGISRDRPWTY